MDIIGFHINCVKTMYIANWFKRQVQLHIHVDLIAYYICIVPSFIPPNIANF